MESEAPKNEVVDIEVACATAERQRVIPLVVRAGCTLGEAIRRSGVLLEFPEISLEQCQVGVFGRLRGLDEPVQAGDRVEIYRPLTADPKQARRQRAKKNPRT